MTTGRTGVARTPFRSRYRFDEEPSLQEMINDPVMQAVMARDGVEPAMLVTLVAEMRIRLERRAEVAAELA